MEFFHPMIFMDFGVRKPYLRFCVLVHISMECYLST